MSNYPPQGNLSPTIVIGEIDDATLVIESEGIASNDNDTTFPTSAAVKDYSDTTSISNTLTDSQILVGNGSNVATDVAVTGDISITNAGVVAITSGVILNADVNASAAIDYSKLAALTDGNILVGNGSNVAVSVNPSGDIDISNAGVFSISSDVIVNADVNSAAAIAYSKLNLTGAILNADLAGSITAANLVGTDIDTVGTITTGVWQGTVVASAFLDSDTAHLTTTQTFSGLKTFSDNVTITATKELFFGLGSDTSIHEVSANVLQFQADGSQRFQIDTNGMTIFSANDLRMNGDDTNILFGTDQDAGIVYDGTDLVINTALVGTGDLKVKAQQIIVTKTGSTQRFVMDRPEILIDDTNIGVFRATAFNAASASKNYAQIFFTMEEDTAGAEDGSIKFNVLKSSVSTDYLTINDGNLGTIELLKDTNVTGIFTADTYVGQSSIVTLGTIATGVWEGTTVAVNQGGTGVTSSTGTVAVVLSTSPTLITPLLGTPTSGVLTNCTGLPITGITSSTSAEFATLCSDETGSGLLVFGTSPTFITPVLGTPTSGTMTNVTGTSGITGLGQQSQNLDMNDNNLIVIGREIFAAKAQLTIATGSITPTNTNHDVDTESDACTDDLDTIADANAGATLYLRAESDARTVVVKDGVAAIRSAGDFSLDTNTDTMYLQAEDGVWQELSRSDNAA